jgi:hypothetical protein
MRRFAAEVGDDPPCQAQIGSCRLEKFVSVDD